MAVPGVPGKGSPRRCRGAPQGTLPAAGRRGGQQLETAPWLPELCPAPLPGMAGAGGTHAPPAPGGPLSPSPPLGVAGRGRGSGGQVPAPASVPAAGREAGELQKCRPGAAGGAGHCCPRRRQPGIPRRSARRLFPGEPPAAPGHEAEVPKTKDPTLRPLLAKSRRAESISPESFPPPPAELRAGPVAPSRAVLCPAQPCRAVPSPAVAAGPQPAAGGGASRGGWWSCCVGDGREHPPGEVRGEWSRDLKELPRKGATQTCGRPPNPICRAAAAKRRRQGLFISRRSGGSGPRIARR